MQKNEKQTDSLIFLDRKKAPFQDDEYIYDDATAPNIDITGVDDNQIHELAELAGVDNQEQNDETHGIEEMTGMENQDQVDKTHEIEETTGVENQEMTETEPDIHTTDNATATTETEAINDEIAEEELSERESYATAAENENEDEEEGEEETLYDGAKEIKEDGVYHPSTMTPSVQKVYGLRPNRRRNYSYTHQALSHTILTQYGLNAGLWKFKEQGEKAITDEMKLLHDMKVFVPIHANQLSEQQKKEAIGSLIFLKEKRDGRIKGRACANGSTQRSLFAKEDAASPTVSVEAVLMSCVIDAKE